MLNYQHKAGMGDSREIRKLPVALNRGDLQGQFSGGMGHKLELRACLGGEQGA